MSRTSIPIHHGSTRGNRVPPESEITVIDAARAVVVDRIPLHDMSRTRSTWRSLPTGDLA